MFTLVQYILSLLLPGLQGGDTRVHGLCSFEGRFIVMSWNTRGPPMSSWVFPPDQVRIGPQPLSSGAAAGYSSEVCLPLFLLSASSLWATCSWKWFSFLSLSVFSALFWDLSHLMGAQQAFECGFSINCSQASRGKLFTGKSCGFWAWNSGICPGAEEP